MKKKLHRFLEREESSGVIHDERLVHQIAQVLKLKKGEEALLFGDTGNERRIEFTLVSKKEVAYTIKEVIPRTEHIRHVTAALAITKGDHFELAVQKLSEIGVSEIIPLITDRTIKTSIRIDRLQAISDEAVELSGGMHRVRIHEPIVLKEAFETTVHPWIVCEEGSAEKPLLEGPCIFAVGPEGGWTDTELALFREHSAHAWSLGERVLRAETAAIIGGYRLIWE